MVYVSDSGVDASSCGNSASSPCNTVGYAMNMTTSQDVYVCIITTTPGYNWCSNIDAVNGSLPLRSRTIYEGFGLRAIFAGCDVVIADTGDTVQLHNMYISDSEAPVFSYSGNILVNNTIFKNVTGGIRCEKSNCIVLNVNITSSFTYGIRCIPSDCQVCLFKSLYLAEMSTAVGIRMVCSGTSRCVLEDSIVSDVGGMQGFGRVHA